MRKLLITLAAATCLAVPALAQDNPQLAQNDGYKISHEQALEIARKNGLVTLEEIERDDGKWEIEGRDAQGREIEIDIHGQSGEVLKVERD